ncbi:MAG TPA: hypothetical protein VJG90_00010 [Candidatus Nanoarchaeia archaeon]|nr:hypothetical protein [Candidatus Nanoarchaeia archaeon]
MAKHKGYVAAYRDGEVLSEMPKGFKGGVVLTFRGRRFALKVLAYTKIPFDMNPFYRWVSAATPLALREPSLLGRGNKIRALYQSVGDLINKV